MSSAREAKTIIRQGLEDPGHFLTSRASIRGVRRENSMELEIVVQLHALAVPRRRTVNRNRWSPLEEEGEAEEIFRGKSAN